MGKEEALRGVGVSAFLKKPAMPGTMVEMLKRVLG
jgi:hypothetical protein